jgi:hypothetical protein
MGYIHNPILIVAIVQMLRVHLFNTSYFSSFLKYFFYLVFRRVFKIFPSKRFLLSTCPLSVQIWSAINRWLGLQMVAPGLPCISFDSFGYPFNCRKRRQGLHMMWQATCWSIWKARNSKIFYGKYPSVSKIVDAIKRTSLQWLTAKRSGSVCLAYEWLKFPLECLAR